MVEASITNDFGGSLGIIISRSKFAKINISQMHLIYFTISIWKHRLLVRHSKQTNQIPSLPDDSSDMREVFPPSPSLPRMLFGPVEFIFEQLQKQLLTTASHHGRSEFAASWLTSRRSRQEKTRPTAWKIIQSEPPRTFPAS